MFRIVLGLTLGAVVIVAGLWMLVCVLAILGTPVAAVFGAAFSG